MSEIEARMQAELREFIGKLQCLNGSRDFVLYWGMKYAIRLQKETEMFGAALAGTPDDDYYDETTGWMNNAVEWLKDV